MLKAISEPVNQFFSSSTPFEIILYSVGGVYLLWGLKKVATTSPEDLKQAVGRALIQTLKVVPGVAGKMDEENQKVLRDLEHQLHKYQDLEKFTTIPAKGRSYAEILKLFEGFNEKEDGKWKNGKVSGAVYHGGLEHTKFLTQVYGMYALSNPLHPDIWPSVRKFEAEIIRMTANMLGGDADTVGATTSGGTESILLAIKAYRDRAVALNPKIKPEMVIPVSAHAAFDKGGHYFGVKVVHIPLGEDYAVDFKKLKAAVNHNTIMIVANSPAFPHGIIDPIPEIAAFAKEKNIPLHVDCCLGGFILPFYKKLGEDIPDFDFKVPGVTSISADTHKYGYASKGTSVLLFKNKDYRKYMYFVTTEWPGGLYSSPGIAGSRPGALIAACWASIVALGEEGYLKNSERILEAFKKIKAEIKKIPGLYVLGDPNAMVIAFGSKEFDIYKVADVLGKKDWSLNVLHKPSCIHLCVTLLHTGENADKFLDDLREAAAAVKANPSGFKDGMAPMYGTAATLPDRSLINDFVVGYLDVILKA